MAEFISLSNEEEQLFHCELCSNMINNRCSKPLECHDSGSHFQPVDKATMKNKILVALHKFVITNSSNGDNIDKMLRIFKKVHNGCLFDIMNSVHDTQLCPNCNGDGCYNCENTGLVKAELNPHLFVAYAILDKTNLDNIHVKGIYKTFDEASDTLNFIKKKGLHNDVDEENLKLDKIILSKNLDTDEFWKDTECRMVLYNTTTNRIAFAGASIITCHHVLGLPEWQDIEVGTNGVFMVLPEEKFYSIFQIHSVNMMDELYLHAIVSICQPFIPYASYNHIDMTNPPSISDLKSNQLFVQWVSSFRNIEVPSILMRKTIKDVIEKLNIGPDFNQNDPNIIELLTRVGRDFLLIGLPLTNVEASKVIRAILLYRRRNDLGELLVQFNAAAIFLVEVVIVTQSMIIPPQQPTDEDLPYNDID